MVLFMETSDSKLEKRLAKSLIGVIVSLAVFACGFATIVLHFNKGGFETKVFVLICYLASLPLISFIAFLLKIKNTNFTTEKTMEENQNLSKKSE